MKDPSKVLSRRSFMKSAGIFAGVAVAGKTTVGQSKKLQISLAQWSLHRAIQKGLISALDFPRVARESFGIEGLEFVNFLWAAPTHRYVQQLKRNINDTGTKALVLWIGAERQMGHSERAQRRKAVQDHFKWIDIAAELGCHSIQANMETDLEPRTSAEIEALVDRCAESFNELCEYAAPRSINVLTENHSNTASNPETLEQLMKKVNRSNLGTLPDFGNFGEGIDRYEWIRRLMPYAKALSFKCYDFSSAGDETTMDMDRMMDIVVASGYSGWVGIEYEGRRLTEYQGIQAALEYLNRYLAGRV